MPPTPANILVVDDEPDTCENLRDILTDLGFHVDIATDARSALRLVDEQPYDIALLDLKMPGMGGLELYREIHQRRASTVALIITAYASSETAASALRAGAWRILSKPIDFPALLKQIDSALEQPLLMVVDDDRDLCSSLWDVLRDQGFRVALAHRTDEARRGLASREFEVVIIDMKLPDSDGLEVLHLVRESHPGTKTILITGYRSEMEARIRQALARGADAVCYKPFDTHELLAQLRAFTAR